MQFIISTSSSTRGIYLRLLQVATSLDHRILISRRSTEDKLSLALPDDVGAIGYLRRRPDPVVITVAGSSASWPIAVQLLHVLAVQALRAGLLERGVALALPLHRVQLAGRRLPVIGEIAGGAGGRMLVIPTSGRALSGREAGRGIRVVVGGVLGGWRPQGRRRHRHVHRLRLPVPFGVPLAVPADRDPVVVERTLRQRADVLIRQVADARCNRVRVQALLVVHYTVHRVLAARLAYRAAPRAGTPCAIPRDHGTSLHSARSHRLR